MKLRRETPVVVFLSVLAFLYMALPSPIFSDPPRPVNRNIFYLCSYDQQMSWSTTILQGVKDVLRPEENNLTLHIFNMDSKQFYDPKYFDAVRDFLAIKYRDLSFSLILCSDNNAFELLRAHRDTLFPGVPVVFCGVNLSQSGSIQGLKGFTGISETPSALDTVQIILRNHPETRRILILNDYLETGRLWKQDIEQELSVLSDRIQFIHNENLPLDELKRQIAALGPGDVVLLGVYYTDRDGQSFTYEKTGALLAGASSVPVYCLADVHMGSGVVGGMILDGYQQGKAMAQMALRVLAGEDPDNIPVAGRENNRPIFDYHQLKRFHIPLDRLPAEAFIQNTPPSFYNTYEKEIQALACFVGLLLILVAILAFHIRLRLKAEKELRISEERFRQLSDSSSEGIVMHEQGIALYFNQVFLDMYGYTTDELKGKDVLALLLTPESCERARERVREDNCDPYEAVGVRKNGQEFPIEIRARYLELEGRRVRVSSTRDLTHQKRMEAHLVQSQKLEAIGTLAGGIAHDFNNILSAIMGYAQLAQLETPQGSGLANDLDQILTASNRARDLVRQILTFSRQTKNETAPVCLATIVKETQKMLRATLPTTIEIRTLLESDAYILADPTQIHQVLMNLATNAALAMRAEGGTLEVQLKNRILTPDEIPSYPGIQPGKFVQLSVGDTGCGMSPEVQRRIFEPFFTTRSPGEGTGLGLSMVHGIVHDLGGTIIVYSEKGMGSVFRILLPVYQEQVEDAGTEAQEEELPRGNERILVVDDETFQTDLASRILSGLGYRVTTVNNSPEALDLFQKDPDAFDLVISDVTMPKMTGDALIARLRSVRSDIPVMLCTGYSERVSQEKIEEWGIQAFAIKPISRREMAEKVREALSR
jgi:PAS domain S-box-containing protein